MPAYAAQPYTESTLRVLASLTLLLRQAIPLAHEHALPALPHRVRLEVDLRKWDKMSLLAQIEPLVQRVARIQQHIQRDTDIRRDHVLQAAVSSCSRSPLARHTLGSNGCSTTAEYPSAANMSTASVTVTSGSTGKNGWTYARSSIVRPCARHAARKRSEMGPMEPHTSSAEMPVRSSSHVNTTPSPQIVVRNVRKDTASAILPARQSQQRIIGREKPAYTSAGTGTPRLFTQPKTRGAWPLRASESSMRELA